MAIPPILHKPLRLWPGVGAAVVLILVRGILPLVAPEAQFFGLDAKFFGLLGAAVSVLVITLWWVLFSRAPWAERLGAVVLIAVAMAATRPLTHMSVQNGFNGMMFVIYAVPVVCLALVAWAVASRGLFGGPRWAALVATILFASGLFTLIRTNGVLGGGADLAWRWTPTAEEKLLALVGDEPRAQPKAPTVAESVAKPIPAPTLDPASPPNLNKEPALPSAPATANTTEKQAEPSSEAKSVADWPGFRGRNRDSNVRGVQIKTDWVASPPVELWRRPVGPAWSSFAVQGDLLYTQEQRGDDELVACYNLTSGKPVWMHRDTARFWESNGGAGPRATPALSNGRVYTLGATGILNALDASSGAVVWSRNAATDTGAPNPGWGFAGSPLVVGDVVIVAASGRLAGYDVKTGQPRWFGAKNGAGYSSPHLVTLGGVPQVLLLRGSRTTSLSPADGKLLWEHTGERSVSIVQPALTASGDLLIAPGDAMGGLGIRRIAITQGPAGWTPEVRWTSRGLKPYFNDFVVHEGHAFGFDGSILSSISLEDGTRTWKGGRFGNGQLMLLPDQDLLLVLSELGELALVGATSDQFKELARFKAMEGKSWNHPVIVGDILLVRNGEEMVAFRLPLAGR